MDRKTIEMELEQVRLARIEAEAASSDVEAMIWQVQHFEPGRGRLLMFVDKLIPDAAPTPQHG